MKRLGLLFCAAAAALSLAGCGQSGADTREADMSALKANEAQWNQDWTAKDVDKMVAHYADDAVLMSPGMPSSAGKENIRKLLAGMASDPALSLKFEPSHVEVAKSGDIGFTQGAYTLTMTDPSSKKVINDHGSYVTTYRKQSDGSWKAVSDIATSEVPPPAMAPMDSKTK